VAVLLHGDKGRPLGRNLECRSQANAFTSNDITILAFVYGFDRSAIGHFGSGEPLATFFQLLQRFPGGQLMDRFPFSNVVDWDS
jgi:hypothetical protein